MCPASGVGTEVNLLAQGTLEVSLWRVRRGRWFAAIIVVGVASERERERERERDVMRPASGVGTEVLAQGTLKVSLWLEGH